MTRFVRNKEAAGRPPRSPFRFRKLRFRKRHSFEPMNFLAPKPKIVIICGPTASGKTSVAIRLACGFGGEIISADSRQIYRHLDIGSAKPTAGEQALVRHHLIDIVEPDEAFDARKFGVLARAAAMETIERKMVPFVAGGTGLYVKSMLHGLFEDYPSAPAVRRELKDEAEKFGGGVLHERLKKVDPETAERLHPNDVQRIVRALEVYEISGKPISRLHREHRFSEEIFDALKIGLFLDREVLYERIDRRVDAMISEGLLDEVRGLVQRGYASDLESLKAIGYSHMIDFIQGRLSWEEAVETLKRDTRRYAKRQMTWFRADPEFNWMKPSEIEAMEIVVERFLKTNGLAHKGLSVRS